MANSKQAKKRVRSTARRTEVNAARRSRIGTFTKKTEAAIRAGDKAAATDAFKKAQPEIARGVTRGVLHKSTAARKLSRLNSAIKAL